jgi:lysophospholipase L1-like esterase
MMETRMNVLRIAGLAALLVGCSTSDSPVPGTGGAVGNGGSVGSGGSPSGGSSGGSSTGGSATGGSKGSGGAVGTGGLGATGGSPETGGKGAGGATITGGGPGSGGKGTGGESAAGGAAAGGRSGSGGAPATGGSAGGTTGVGGAAGAGGAGNRDGGAQPGIDGGSTGFDPCPASDPCKILPLGDSITWGINYGGGYRIKLYAHAVADSKNITFVGYDSGNPPDQATLTKLGSAGSKFVNKHEGHSGWTIQQDDDLVTGKSTATNDGVSYTGKKVVTDFGPHIVLIHLGTNDMYQTPTGAPDRLGTLIDHVVAAAPDALVVVSNIIPFPSGASAVTTFNNAVPGVVKQRTDAGKHVIFVDQFKGFATSDLGTDQVHPNEGGYEKMATVWYAAIKAYLH